MATKENLEGIRKKPRSGRAKRTKRPEILLYEELLKNLPVPFFTLDNEGLSRDIPAHLVRKYAVPVSFNGKEMYCLRRDFPGNVVKEQLALLTGRVIKTTKKISARIFLKNVSLDENEAFKLLNINESTLKQMVHNQNLDTIHLEGALRFWRQDIERLKKEPALFRGVTKNQVRYDIPHTAVLLGLSTGQVKRLINEGQLKPYELDPRNGLTAHLFTGEEINQVQRKLPEILHKWRQLRNKGRISANSAEFKPRPLRRLTHKPELPALPQGEVQLDDFQVQAIAALRAGQSVLLSAPTGNGKTLVAEILAKDLMDKGQSLVYTSPLKALSNQKYRDFKNIFGEDRVGLVTGDVNINPNAPLLIMTTEIFRNWCIGEQELLAAVEYVIFDEFHYLDDSDRGTTWEESILFAPTRIKILGLSATVPNIAQIAAWVSSVRGEDVVIIKEEKRQVPLNICWLSSTGQIINQSQAKVEVKELVEYQRAFRSRKHWAVN